MEGVQKSLLAGEVGAVYLIIDETRKDDPYLVGSIREGRGQWETGWCKTRTYCEKKIRELESAGLAYEGVVNVGEGPQDLLDQMRVSRFHVKDLKSALQKLIRRGHWQEAVDVAYTLAAGELWWLAVRFPILAVEDAGWDWLGMLPQKPMSEPDVLWITEGMARVPKNQEAAALPWVSDLGMDGPEGELAFLLDLWKENRQEEVETHLNRRLYEGVPEFTERCVQKAMWRLGMRGMSDDHRMLISGAVLALNEQPKMFEHEFPVLAEPKTVVDLPWWCFDGHSQIGKKVLYRLAGRLRMDPKRLSTLWFAVESIKVHETRSTRWREPSRDAWARTMGWPDYGHMEGEWAYIRNDVAEAVKAELA